MVLRWQPVLDSKVSSCWHNTSAVCYCLQFCSAKIRRICQTKQALYSVTLLHVYQKHSYYIKFNTPPTTLKGATSMAYTAMIETTVKAKCIIALCRGLN